jgi:hypothetical protein
MEGIRSALIFFQDPMREAWNDMVSTIVELAVQALPKLLKGNKDKTTLTSTQLLALAAYRVTYEGYRPAEYGEMAFDEEEMPSTCRNLKSFAWILPQELLSLTAEAAKV